MTRKPVGSGPATSQAQYRYMQGIAHGMKPRGGDGPSEAQAKEFVSGQSPKGLPERKGKGGGDMGGKQTGEGGTGGRFIQIHSGSSRKTGGHSGGGKVGKGAGDGTSKRSEPWGGSNSNVNQAGDMLDTKFDQIGKGGGSGKKRK